MSVANAHAADGATSTNGSTCPRGIFRLAAVWPQRMIRTPARDISSSNAMFGSLQRVTAEQLGLDPLLVCTANSTGGVMGKMIDAQSIVVSATATGTHGAEGAILRRVFPHSLALALLVGLLVWLQAGPLAWMVP